ncbi:MAG: YifB family Mg chelatase-like AAA ATPase [Lachnospiraceae bacterium]|nr:YifB family Mg chelatase-like AAA ATPase [Lachnospiraceae bacterium]
MFSKILSGTIYGMDCHLVHVEADLSKGLPCFVMVGNLGSEVKEAGERVRIALKNSGIILPPMHIAVNISPGNIRKEGTGFDLPIAIAVLSAMGKLPMDAANGFLLLGELSLDGHLKPVRGMLPISNRAVKAGISRCIVARDNAREAAAITQMEAIGADSLQQVVEYLCLGENGRKEFLPACPNCAPGAETKKETVDFEEVRGQESVKRGALIAAAGFHHMLIAGPPGAGKTMIARRLPTILPPLSEEESLEVSSIYSISGQLPADKPLMTRRPFLSPHHTVSPQALAGGGKVPKPGVISLAHRGVLFLDELPEFKRQTLDLLRQPLEDRTIQISRSSGTFCYPADIMLCAAMNPCPCGYYPDRNKCRCTPFEIHTYLSHISGPILDRMDICVMAPRIELSQLQNGRKGESSASMRDKVIKARKMQKTRYRGTAIRFNSELGAGEIEKYCSLGSEERKMMEQLFRSMKLSARAYHRLLKVARTIADLDASEQIRKEHLAQAACYRTLEIFDR